MKSVTQISKDMARKILLSVLLAMATIATNAQNVYLLAEQKQEMTKDDASLNGYTAIVFVSSKDLVITSSSQDIDQFKSPKKNSKGQYEYEVLCKGRESRTFSISVRGSVHKTQAKKSLVPNKRFYFLVDEVANPITFNEQTEANEARLNENEACVEFMTTIKGLQVDYHRGLPCVREDAVSSSGAYIIRIVINDMKKFLKVKENYYVLKDEAQAIENKIEECDSKGIIAPIELLERNESLIKKLDEAERLWGEISLITLYGPNTNKLQISIDGLGMKQKKSIAVMSLGTTFDNLKQQFEDAVAKESGYTMSSQFLYEAQLLEKMAEHADCPPAQREELHNKRVSYLEIRKRFYAVEQFINKWETLSAQKGPTDSVAVRYLGGVRNQSKKLMEAQPHVKHFATLFEKYDSLFKKRIDTTIVERYPVVDGRCTFNPSEWVWGKANNIAIYALHNPVARTKDLEKLQPIAHTGADGSFRIVIRDPEVKYLHFMGCKRPVSIKPNTTQTISVRLSDR